MKNSHRWSFSPQFLRVENIVIFFENIQYFLMVSPPTRLTIGEWPRLDYLEVPRDSGSNLLVINWYCSVSLNLPGRRMVSFVPFLLKLVPQDIEKVKGQSVAENNREGKILKSTAPSFLRLLGSVSWMYPWTAEGLSGFGNFADRRAPIRVCLEGAILWRLTQFLIPCLLYCTTSGSALFFSF